MRPSEDIRQLHQITQVILASNKALARGSLDWQKGQPNC